MLITNSWKEAWKSDLRKERWNPVYRDSLLKYSECLNPLFEKAKTRSEFEFILTLLRVRGVRDAGWDPWKTTVRMFDDLIKLVIKVKDPQIQR